VIITLIHDYLSLPPLPHHNMSSQLKKKRTQLQRELEEAEEIVEKKRKLIVDETLKNTNDWFSDTDNLKKWVKSKDIELSFSHVRDGKLVYTAKNLNINNDGSYQYRVYKISCILEVNHKVFSEPWNHKTIYTKDVLDNLKFTFVEDYYDSYY